MIVDSSKFKKGRLSLLAHVQCKGDGWINLCTTIEGRKWTGNIRLRVACLLPACSYSYHIFSLCRLITLIIHNFHSVSPPTKNLGLPLSQIFPTIDSLPASWLTIRILWLDCSSEHLGFCFLQFLHCCFCLVPFGRLSWLFVSFLAHVNILYHIVSYRIIRNVGVVPRRK